MPISGIKCDKEVVDSLLELRDHREHRFIFYKIRRNGKGVSVNFCRKGKRDASFSDFLREVPKEEPRYIIYDFTYMTKEWEKRDRILFIFWSPDKARCEDKVHYTSTKSSILKEVQKVFAMKHIEVTDFNELKENTLIEYGQPLRERENSLSAIDR